MRTLTLALAAGCLVLTGCASPIAAPERPSDDDAHAFAQQMLDGTHEHLDIPGNTVDSAAGLMDYDSWNLSMTTCLDNSGIENTSVGWTDSAYELYTYDGVTADPAKNKALYACLVAYPLDLRTIGRLYTDEQREYVWNYYQRWVIPCLTSRNITVQFMPSYQEFSTQTLYLWTPYDGVDPTSLLDRLSLFDRSDPYSALEDICGPRYGVVEP